MAPVYWLFRDTRQTTNCCDQACQIPVRRESPGRAHTKSSRGFHFACSIRLPNPRCAASAVSCFLREIPDCLNVPKEDVHFHRFHTVQISFENIHGRKMAARINQQTAPWETRLILNRYGRSSETVRSYFNKLQKCLQATKNAERICGIEFCSGWHDLERVGLIFTQFLNFLAGVIGVNDQRRSRGILNSLGGKQSCLTLQLGQKAVGCAIESGFAVTSESNRKVCVNRKRAGAEFHAGRLRHQIQRWRILRSRVRNSNKG